MFEFGFMNYNTTFLEGNLEAAECGKVLTSLLYLNKAVYYQVYMHVTVSLQSFLLLCQNLYLYKHLVHIVQGADSGGRAHAIKAMNTVDC